MEEYEIKLSYNPKLTLPWDILVVGTKFTEDKVYTNSLRETAQDRGTIFEVLDYLLTEIYVSWPND